MKKIIAVMLMVCLCAGYAVAEEKSEPEKSMTKMANNMGRGFANILTGWLEIPRGLWYEGSRNPFYGQVVGLLNGSFLTVARTVGGAADVLTLGLTGPGIYGESFPDYVWQAKWNPDDKMLDQK